MKKFFLFSLLFFLTFFFLPKKSLAFCEDSDAYAGGVVPQLYIPGTCRDSSGTYHDKCAGRIGFYDYDIIEYVCEWGKCVEKTNTCLYPAGGRAPCYTDSQGRGFCKGNLFCQDTDGGKKISEAGWCKEIYLGQVIKSFEDRCEDERRVREFFCLEGLTSPPNCQFEILECPPNSVCQGGRCIEPACEDPDGADIFTYGECRKIEGPVVRIAPDTCEKDGKTVNEKVCKENECKSELIECPDGYKCENGRCVRRIEITCEETDGGKNILKKGRCIKKIGNQEESLEDVCVDSKRVNEKYCGLDQKGNLSCLSETISCPENHICQDGQCVGETCHDGDGGKNIYRAELCEDNWGSYRDQCAGIGKVKEFFCKEGKCDYEILSCNPGEVCVDGKCEKIICEDSDQGKNILEKGVCYEKSEGFIRVTKTDTCSHERRKVNEFYCENNRCEVEIIECDPEYFCQDGRCVKETCIDEDGEDVYKKGKCQDKERSFEDECLSEVSVKEFVCDKGKCVEKHLSCKLNEKCKDGRCVKITCEDTDGGKDKNTYGECVLDGKTSCSDECSSETQVKECYCEEGECKSEILNCESNEICKNGKCVKKPEEEGICTHLMPCPLGKCTVCHFFLLLQRVINCILFGILPPLAVLMLVIGGGVYLGGAFGILPGELETFSQAKRILTFTIFGVILTYSVWIILNLFLILLGFTQEGGRWWEIKCEIEETSSIFQRIVFLSKIL